MADGETEHGIPEKLQDLVPIFSRRVGLDRRGFVHKRLVGQGAIEPFDLFKPMTDTLLQFPQGSESLVLGIGAFRVPCRPINPFSVIPVTETRISSLAQSLP